jgi:hypothetical protein
MNGGQQASSRADQARAADGASGEAAGSRAEPALEPWASVSPHVHEWLESEERPDAALLLTYARALVDAARLDELGCLVEQLERSCEGRAACVPMLREFAEAVDGMVRESFGGRFHPLEHMRAVLLQG